jgi:hypothetical protein
MRHAESAQPVVADAPAQAIGFFERYLTLWVALCIVAGIGLGQAMPGFFATVASMELAQVNLPVGALIWVMIIPMLIRIVASGSIRQGSQGNQGNQACTSRSITTPTAARRAIRLR